jgi:Zn ribbon nucleic-acid-binding protein
MSQSKKGKLNYRCPSCFAREIDMDMFYDEEKKEYYCIRCCYHGTEEEVKKANELCKLRYKHIADRITNIGADNEPIDFHPYKKGEL